MDFAKIILMGICQAFVGVLYPAPTRQIAAAQKLLFVLIATSILGLVVGAVFVTYFPTLPGITVILISLGMMLVAAAGGNSIEMQIRNHNDNQSNESGNSKSEQDE